MVQRYPTSGNSFIEVQRPPAPPSVLNAVKLMYAGAAVSTVSLVISLADISGTKAAIKKARPNLTATQISQLNTLHHHPGRRVRPGSGSRCGCGCRWANGQGKNWARIVSTVLFGLATLDLIGVFSQPKTVLGLVFPVLTWLVGLGAVFLLWRPDSSAFFKPQGLA